MRRKLPLITQLIMWKDYFIYIIVLQKTESLHLGIELSLFIISLIFLIQDFLPTGSGGSNISIILALVVFQFLWDMYNTKKEINSYFNIQHSILRNPNNIAELVPSPKERTFGFESIAVDTKKTERVFVSDIINKYIQSTSLSIKLSPKKRQKITTYIHHHKEVLLQYLNYYFFSSLKNNRAFTNDEKLCMSGDITPHSKQVVCHTSGYYDSFLTNQISGTTLVIQDTKHTTISTEEIFPIGIDENNHIHLADISSSPLNHHIGGSTLGFTKDNKFIVWTQGNTNQFGHGLLVPTGSGSANASDMIATDFQKTVIAAMERELQEESVPVKKPNTQYHTMLLGFYRWVSRGGKPEFVGLTKLPENADFYHPNTSEVQQLKRHIIFELPSIDRLLEVITNIRKTGTLSVPLFMCLRQLEYMYHHDKQTLESFLFAS